MQRSKLRKAVAALPAWLPPAQLKQALGKVMNPKTRAKVESRFLRRLGAR